MTGATHFIEVWKDHNGKLITEPVKPNTYYHYETCLTKNCGFTTIAIWKIKFKTKDNENKNLRGIR